MHKTLLISTQSESSEYKIIKAFRSQSIDLRWKIFAKKSVCWRLENVFDMWTWRNFKCRDDRKIIKFVLKIPKRNPKKIYQRSYHRTINVLILGFEPLSNSLKLPKQLTSLTSIILFHLNSQPHVNKQQCNYQSNKRRKILLAPIKSHKKLSVGFSFVESKIVKVFFEHLIHLSRSRKFEVFARGR